MNKRKTEYKTSERPKFCRLAKELVDDQENEIEKAVIGVGNTDLMMSVHIWRFP